MGRRTAQLFDLMFKSIIKDASHPAIVHLINGIYNKNYPLNTTSVKIEPTEFIKEYPKSGKLEKIVTDIVITLYSNGIKDTYLMEAQIDDDIEMSLRVFNYSLFFALENKTVSGDGSSMQIDMPAPVVIYWETSKTKDIVSVKIRFPNKKSILYKIPTFKVLQHSVPELGNMALLLPFYILKIREELEKKGTDSEKRKRLSKELEGYIIEIGKVLTNCKENNYISGRDVSMLLRRLLGMNAELYGGYSEFREVNMNKRWEKIIDPDFCKRYDAAEKKAFDKAIAKAVAIADKKAEKRGLKEGISQGLSQTAAAMKAGGEAIDKIMLYTGLSRREIMGL
jgi:hypothetical protein